MGNIRKPAVAGSFYPSSKKELVSMIARLMDSAAPAKNLSSKEIKAILVPHAGYVFSGKTAAAAWAAVKEQKPDTIILAGTSHGFLTAKAALWSGGTFLSPSGESRVEEAAARLLSDHPCGLFEENPEPHIREHSLEVQLPFIHNAAPGAKIVPALLSASFSPRESEEAGKAMADVVRKLPGKTLIAASSDLSHFPSDATARMWDSRVLEAAAAFDLRLLEKIAEDAINSPEAAEDGLETAICGKEALIAAISAAEELGADAAEILDYSNSSEFSGDKSRVVGYGAAMFFRRLKNDVYSGGAGRISDRARRMLLDIAREAIARRASPSKTPPGTSAAAETLPDELKKPAAVFVTLSKGGQLRGCIGVTEPSAPLAEAVAEMARAAAFGDPRFAPVTSAELKDIVIEISVLGPLKRVASADDIAQGRDGAAVKRGRRGGLFLPQVWEHFDDKEEFLRELCSQKAGLPADAWKEPDTEIYVFRVEKFSE